MSKQTIAAFFDDRQYADKAAAELKQLGLSSSDVTVSPQGAQNDLTASTSANWDNQETKGFWASLKELFDGSEEHHTYTEGLRRGGTLVTARVEDAHLEQAISILEKHGSIDIDERETAWQAEGWTGRSSAATSDRLAATDATALRDTSVGQDNVLQVMEEQVSIGKRAVNRGKVRIHSYVVETPVSEDVTLREETVSIDRRPVNRVISTSEIGRDAFQDRTIEVDEMREEAVVGKTARVVEEIGLRKDAAERVETIHDTVRSTKVDVEDARTTATTSSFKKPI